jgi:hypothetical protein
MEPHLAVRYLQQISHFEVPTVLKMQYMCDMCVDWSIVGLLEVDHHSLVALMFYAINAVAVHSNIPKMPELFKTKVERCVCTEPGECFWSACP